MQTIAEQIYPDDYRRFEAVMTDLQAGRLGQADQAVAALEQQLASIQSPSQRLQVELFLNALNCRLKHAKAQNLYLVADDGQQIKMFNFMAQHFPVVQAAQKIANSIFQSKLAGENSFTILDIGIGSGMQMANLIQQLLDAHSGLQSISVIGIEPSAESLSRAKSRIEALASETNIPLTFTGIQKTVEQLDADDWELFKSEVAASNGAFLVNASFALHHIRPLELRTSLFRHLKALSPKALVMIEPYGDYTSDNLLTRFQNAWHHYGLTFRAIDTIDADEEDKNALKSIFFGREMIDVLSEGDRIEQFEPADKWMARLKDAGFSIEDINQPLPRNFNPMIEVQATDSYVGFNVSGCPIVAILCAV